MSTSSFDTTKRSLEEILKSIHSGKMQLPDFQRGWVWDDDRIRSLLASIAVSFPIGAAMLLETGGAGVNFKPRPVEGVSIASHTKPDVLILDGQQRFTSLYQSLMLETAVKTKNTQNKPVDVFYYLDMQQLVTDDYDEETAILSVSKDRKKLSDFGRTVDLDLSTSDLEFHHHMFPANHLFQSADWRTGYQEYWQYASEKMRLFNEFERQVIKRFEQYHMPVIQLSKDTPKEAVCLVFEKVNTGGVPLTVFELLTATFAADNFQLRDDWEAREKRLKTQHRALKGMQSDDFLQAISLLVTYECRKRAIEERVSGEKLPGIGCKRPDLLRLEVKDYLAWADRVEEGFARAARFLYSQYIFRHDDVPYRTQLVPLSASFVALGLRTLTISEQKRLARWYWCGVLGELYGGAVESRFARDLPDLIEYVPNGETEPKTVQDAGFDANRFLSLRTRNSAAYKGIHALLMRGGCKDFRTGDEVTLATFFDLSIDIHHVFPQKWCWDNRIADQYCNSIVNKSALSAQTNRMIGGSAPSIYLGRLRAEAELSEDEQTDILRSHLIDYDALSHDDFQRFFARRAGELATLVEEAMGKTVAKAGADFLVADVEQQETNTNNWLEDTDSWSEQAEIYVEEVAAKT